MPTQPRTLEEFNLNVVTLYVHYASLCFCKRIGNVRKGLLFAQIITLKMVLGNGNFSDEEIRFSFVYFYLRRINEQL